MSDALHMNGVDGDLRSAFILRVDIPDDMDEDEANDIALVAVEHLNAEVVLTSGGPCHSAYLTLEFTDCSEEAVRDRFRIITQKIREDMDEYP